MPKRGQGPLSAEKVDPFDSTGPERACGIEKRKERSDLLAEKHPVSLKLGFIRGRGEG